MTGNVIQKSRGAALVIGAGIAGIKAGLELAESGVRTYLCDQRPYIGGTLAQLDQWFPNDHCSLCQVLPSPASPGSGQYCLRLGLSHPNIELLPSTEVGRVEGEAGDFTINLTSRASGLKPDLCTGCGRCEPVCPIEVDDRPRTGKKRKAIYLPHPLARPGTFVIDQDNCTRCGNCVGACPTGAIDLDFVPVERETKVGAIIVSTGFEEFDPLPATRYGYGRFPNVVTSLELERWLSASSPTKGGLQRPSDGQLPRSLAFLQCVGSRSYERDYCSSACCMYALKEAMMVKRKYPGTDVSFFYMDLRAFGKGYYRYYERAVELGVRFIRSRVPAVGQDFRNHNLRLSLVDGSGKIATQSFEMVVLSVGQFPPPRFAGLSDRLGLRLNKWGFCQTRELSPVETSRKGIFVCGSASGPKDIADTLSGATAAAGQALALLRPAREPVPPPGSSASAGPRIATYICNCAGEISQAIAINEVLEFARRLRGVVCAEEVNLLCQSPVLEKVKSQAKEAAANSIILAGCSALIPMSYAENITPEVVNLREGVARVHSDGVLATEKAKRLLAMAVEKAGFREEPSATVATPVIPRALVIGGGGAGLIAALSLASRGLEVELVEKSAEPGGHLKDMHSLLEGGNVRAWLPDLISQANKQPLIHVRKETEVARVTGWSGNFKVSLKPKDGEPVSIDTGAIIIATGAGELRPAEYLYGQARNVLTQMELERQLASGEISPERLKSVVMIQCVGSRERARPYCSRTCCAQALKNALWLKQCNPKLAITIAYRDMMSYGFKEEYFTRAREDGIEFVRYALDSKPEVVLNGDVLEVRARETVLGGELVLRPDLVVLSSAIVPRNLPLAQILGVPVDDDGFFQEAEVKFRPVDFVKEGIYVCGLAHSPQDLGETIVQAQAAAQRAARLLCKEALVSPRTVSRVNQRWCAGCGLCVKACPFEARFIDSEKRVAQVREDLCRGCGACAAACPSGAAELREFTAKQVFSMLDAVI